jgi:phosphatidylglycerophosphate synthase
LVVSVRARLVIAAAVGSVCLAGLGDYLETVLSLSSAYALHACAVFAAIMGVSAWAIPTRHPFGRLGPANVVTTLRALLVALLSALLREPSGRTIAWAAVVGASAAAVLDGVDGYLARRSGTSSDFGARFDMEMDALLILVLCGLVWRYGKAGLWVLLAGALRYAFAAAGWVLPWMRRSLTPTMRAKTVAAGTMVALIVALGPIVQSPLSHGVAALTVAVLAWSFALDVRRLWRQRVSQNP